MKRAPSCSKGWKIGRGFFQPLETLLPALALVSATAFADGSAPILGTNAHAHLRAALACLNMTERDLSFEKDHGKPRAALEGMKRLLARPLELPALGDQALRAVAQGGQ